MFSPLPLNVLLNNIIDVNLEEPKIQATPKIITNTNKLNLINYDEFSAKDSNIYKMNEKDFIKKEKSALNINSNSEEINNILNLNNKVNDLKNDEYKFNVMNYNINQKRNINNFNSINPKKKQLI